MVDGSGREAAMSQPGAELGAVVASQHSIASVEIGCEEVGIPEVVLEPGKGLCLTSCEAMHSLHHNCCSVNLDSCICNCTQCLQGSTRQAVYKRKSKEKTKPFGVNLRRSQVLYQAAQATSYIAYANTNSNSSLHWCQRLLCAMAVVGSGTAYGLMHANAVAMQAALHAAVAIGMRS